jgi:hypothetical protein
VQAGFSKSFVENDLFSKIINEVAVMIVSSFQNQNSQLIMLKYFDSVRHTCVPGVFLAPHSLQIASTCPSS